MSKIRGPFKQLTDTYLKITKINTLIQVIRGKMSVTVDGYVVVLFNFMFIDIFPSSLSSPSLLSKKYGSEIHLYSL